MGSKSALRASVLQVSALRASAPGVWAVADSVEGVIRKPSQQE